MKIKLLSDLHLEFHGNLLHLMQVPETPDDKDTVLVLAGDIGLIDAPGTIIPFIERMCKQFRKVIYVLGNHEYYYDDITTGAVRLKDMLSHTNVAILDNESLVIDDTLFVGATLWSDFENDNSMSKLYASQMADFGCIKGFNTEHGNFTPDEALVLHRKAKEYIVNALSNKPSHLKSVVVSHHLPSWESVHPTFRTGHEALYNGGYYSNLDAIIHGLEPDYWFHGHTHCSMDYLLGNTRVVCNPRGYYPRALNPDFDPGLIILDKNPR